jgi:AcrR family transcriptional regulator
MTTKEKILYEALELFSVKGYDAVSLRDIAARVGIKESSLYNHFSSKRAIFDGILADCAERNDAFFHAQHFINDDMLFHADDATVAMYGAMPPDVLAAVSGQVFEAVFAVEANVKLRRMLTLEQYKSAENAQLFREVSFEAAIAYQTRLFAAMMEAGLFERGDPEVLALEFYAPVFLLFYRYDNTPDGVSKARELFMRHVRQFVQAQASIKKIHRQDDIGEEIAK